TAASTIVDGSAPPEFDQRGAGFNRVVNSQMDVGAFEMPRPLLIDAFNRADSASLGNPWTNQVGTLHIGADEARGISATGVNIATVSGLGLADVNLSVFFNVYGDSAGLVARYAGPGDQNYYAAIVTRTGSGPTVARLLRNVNGVITEFADVNEGSFVGDSVGL